MVAARGMDIRIGEEMVGVAPAVVDRLAEYFADVASGLVRSEQRWAAEYYARALMMDGARKSLEPMVARIGGTGVEDEALQHFLGDSPRGPAGIDRAGAGRGGAVSEAGARGGAGRGGRGAGVGGRGAVGGGLGRPGPQTGRPPLAGGQAPVLRDA